MHCVLAVCGVDGENYVEFVVFAPRFNVTTDKYPTYLPPYDHRNCGKSEIMVNLSFQINQIQNLYLFILFFLQK